MTETDIDNMFTYHAPTDEQKVKYEFINEAFKSAAKVVLANCPSSAERTIAIRKLQEGRMMANAAIALESFLKPFESSDFPRLPGETDDEYYKRRWPNIMSRSEPNG